MSADRPEPDSPATATQGQNRPKKTRDGAADVPLPGSFSELVMLNAMELSQAIHAKRISCREVMEAHLDHIGRVNPDANAIVSLRPREALIAEARERDDRLAHGERA